MALQTFGQVEGIRAGDVIKREMDLDFSRGVRTILAGDGADRVIVLGTVLGARLFDADNIAVANGGGNTGDGAVGAIALGDGAKVGVYTLTCIEAAADAGRFQVVDPDGYRLGDALVGVAYAVPQLGFTIADGAADFVVGDSFAITVPEGDGKAVALDLTATDGTQLADSIAFQPVTAPDGVDRVASCIVGHAVATPDGLTWPDGITADQKSAALARLAGSNIIVR